MRLRHFVTRWLGALGLILSLVGLVSQGTTNAQTPLAETRQSAEQGDVAAQYNLGLSYDYGLGVPQDDTRAVLWYRIAADRGHAAARYNLGVMYRNGEGVPQDFTEAVAWLRQAADEGDVPAQYNLGVMYARGGQATGLFSWWRRSPNYVEAHMWFNLAASRATGESQREYAEARDTLAKQMTPAQIAEAQRLAREWQAAFEERQDERLLGFTLDSQQQ